jgi:hypothetical protein
MGQVLSREQRKHTMTAVATAGLLLLYWLQGCFSPQTKSILPAEKAEWVYVTPNGRWILFQEARHILKLLDPATGQEVLVSESGGTAYWLDDGLLHGGRSGTLGWEYFIVNLEPFAVVNLASLRGEGATLSQHMCEADSVYALKTGTDKYTLLLLKREPDGSVSQGRYVQDVRDLDTLLAGVPYKVPPPLPVCPWGEEAPSPDGESYFINSDALRIYSQQGELLNAISNDRLTCYGWAWDSSGVYIQERKAGMFVPLQVGPLQLLLAEP